MSTDEAAGVVVPLNLLPGAAELVAANARPQVVADDVAARFGRRVLARLVTHEVLSRIRHEPGHGLDTGGPVVLREVILVDEGPPFRPLAACSELIVPDRLPEPVQVDLASTSDPLDRLLTRHRVDWQVILRPDEGFVAPLGMASRDFSWLGEQAGASVELLRLVSVHGRPVAVLIDELPLHSAESEPMPA
jgi:hypothetical protein